MSSKLPIYYHHGNVIFAALATALLGIVIFVVLGATEIAFSRIGFSKLQIILMCRLNRTISHFSPVRRKRLRVWT